MEPNTINHGHKGLFISIIIFAILLIVAFFVWQFAMPKPLDNTMMRDDIMTDVRPAQDDTPSAEDKGLSADTDSALDVNLDKDIQSISDEF